MTEQANMVDAIDVETVERLVYARRHEDALREVYNTLNRIKRGGPIMFYNPANPSLETLFTRIAGAITALMADPLFQLSPEGFMRLVSDHATLQAIFRGSAYRNADHLLGIISDRNPSNPNSLQFTDQNIMKLLACWSLDSDLTLDFEGMSEAMPQIVAAALIGMIAVGGVHTERAHERKIELMRKWPLIEKAPLHELMLIAAGDCYMHCSYVDIPEKHDIKKALNRLMRGLVEGSLKSRGLLCIERHTLTAKERPTVVVPVEWFGSAHAMYRCYVQSVRQLRKRFRVVAITPVSQIDETGRAEFDEVRQVEGQAIGLGDLLAAIAAEDPDIIWYPSIGMAAWWVALSNFRLAPIQVMSPGHPASSHSPCIDAIISDGDLFGDESHYSERCVPMPVGGARYVGREGTDWTKAVRPEDGVVRVAIPAMVMKLAPPFLQAVQRLSQSAKVPLEIHFFPNQTASGHYFIERELKAWVPDCVVHPRMDYQDYIERLGRCNFMMSTFPFGGTNSVVDAFSAGLPVLTLEGDQIHSKSDASMIRRIGGPEWWIAKNVEDYVAKALSMVNSPPRFPITDPNDTPSLLVSDEFFGDGPEEVRDSFLNAMLTIYNERLAYDGRNESGASEGARGPIGDLYDAIARCGAGPVG